MRVLHICSGYPDTKLYQNLIKGLDDKNIEQVMYVPYNSSEIKDKRVLNNNRNIEYIFSHPFNKIDRLLYYTKIQKIYKDVNLKVDLKKISIVHAHFLFSNGGPAYKLKKEFGIDYIVAVRNTDVNYFFKYGLHVRNYGIKILREAKYIIFISPSYKKYVLDNYIPEYLKEIIKKKSYIIPNGIDDFWLDNIYQEKYIDNNPTKIKLISVGELNKNKNVESSIKALNILKAGGYEVSLDIIGIGPLEEELKRLINSSGNEKNITLHGYLKDRNELLRLYRNSDIFIMPSIQETFGLVYIEAMSQGLPVIYSKGQGIDGYFKEGEVGFSVNPTDIDEIASSILQIMNERDEMFHKIIDLVNTFRWSKIADEYMYFYH